MGTSQQAQQALKYYEENPIRFNGVNIFMEIGHEIKTARPNKNREYPMEMINNCLNRVL
jgi:hypothetical protein